MATVTSDIIDGVLTDGPEGVKLTRRFKISGVTGDADQRMLNARLALEINTGTPHPSIPGLYAIDFQIVPLAAGIFDATVNYGPRTTNLIPDESQPPQISVGSVVQAKETNQDYNDDTMEFTVTINDTIAGVTTPRPEPQIGTVTVQVPQTVLRFTRKETEAPYVKSMVYTGRVNSRLFLGDPARYWLCTRIEGDSNDGGLSYTVNYEFQRNADTWDAIVVAEDPKTGKPPPSKKVEGGAAAMIKKFQVYREIDFGGLGIGV